MPEIPYPFGITLTAYLIARTINNPRTYFYCRFGRHVNILSQVMNLSGYCISFYNNPLKAKLNWSCKMYRKNALL